MSTALKELESSLLTDVETTLNYTRKSATRPVNYTYDPPEGIPRSSGESDPRTVTIYDGRRTVGLGLDRSGFELIATHKSSLVDWETFSDPDTVKTVDYPEVAAALRRRTGASNVLIFDHTLRDSTALPGRAALREPVRRVHDDQTLRSAPDRVHKHLPPEEAAWRLQRRFAVINFWRPIGSPVQRAPLAVCDARSIKPDDVIPSDLVYPDWTGETYAIAFSPLHRWYWYPQQSPQEATLLKIYDSATDGRARLTAHTAFDLPNTLELAEAPPRRSVELRALVFW
jgi:hypothetical protein